MAKVGVGLDIGTSSIKLVELEGSNPIRINRFGRIPLPEGALAGGVIKNSEAVAESVSEAFRTLQIKHKRVQVAIAGQAVVVRNIKMPLMEDSEVANAIRWEAERYIPFPVDEVCMDHIIINRDQQQQEMEIMLVCAHNDIINSHIEVLQKAGLQPMAIDIQPFALMRALGMEKVDNTQNVAVLDIGAGTSDLSIFKAGISKFTRILPLAGNRFTENIMKQMGNKFGDAEQLKVKYADATLDITAFGPEVPEYKVNFSAQDTLRELVLEVRRSLDYFHLQQRNEVISKMVVCGGGAKIKNLIDFLKQELDIKVTSSLDAWNIVCNPNFQADFETAKPIMLVALGLALREVTE
ncbi:MAG TPA: type IV pilus assembly protein PilM [Bacillota bacterium]|nr:type IV pilus assembly protein PilM [Bacillota bacterium]